MCCSTDDMVTRGLADMGFHHSLGLDFGWLYTTQNGQRRHSEQMTLFEGIYFQLNVCIIFVVVSYFKLIMLFRKRITLVEEVSIYGELRPNDYILRGNVSH